MAFSKSKKNMKRLSKSSRKLQRGGVGFTFDHGCKVGGLPARVALSDCPNVGPLDSCHIKAMYGQSCKRQMGGSRKSRKLNRSRRSSRSSRSSRSRASRSRSQRSRGSRSRASRSRSSRSRSSRSRS